MAAPAPAGTGETIVRIEKTITLSFGREDILNLVRQQGYEPSPGAEVFVESGYDEPIRVDFQRKGGSPLRIRWTESTTTEE